MAEITDLDANKPVGSGAGAEGMDSADNWLRLIQNVIKTVVPRWFHVEDFSPKPKSGSQDARSTEIASPRDKNPYINFSKGAVQLRLPATGYVYDTGTATTTLGSPTVTGISTLEKWLTNALPGMVWVSLAGNPYTIKSIESETSLTLTTNIGAADVQTAAAYSIRLIYDAGRWPAILPLFAVRRPDGSAGAILENGGLNIQVRTDGTPPPYVQDGEPWLNWQDSVLSLWTRIAGTPRQITAVTPQQPQENLIIGGDGVTAFASLTDVPPGNISFHNGLNAITPRHIYRSNGSDHGALKRDRKLIYEPLVSLPNKIKSSGGKGRFTCSVFVKRQSTADLVGGTFRFGLHDGTSWISGAYVDIAFDDVTTEYKRFYFYTNQIARPTNLTVRLEWTAEPSNWNTVLAGELIGYLGGIMVTNGAGVLSKWDICHKDGSGDTYLASPFSDNIYWWDENITDSEQTVV